MTEADDLAHFGAHLRALRKTRGLTQQALAARSGLSPDSIRRLERGAMSASIDTVRKVAVGLELGLGTLFESYEVHAIEPRREAVDLLRYCNQAELELVLRVARTLLDSVRGSGLTGSATSSVCACACSRTATTTAASGGRE